jgi:hypothetical protein
MKTIENKTITILGKSISLESTGLRGGSAMRMLILLEQEEMEEKNYLRFLSNNPALDF